MMTKLCQSKYMHTYFMYVHALLRYFGVGHHSWSWITSWLLWWIHLFPCIFSQLIQGLIDGEEEFVREMKMFISQQLNFLDSSYRIPVNVLNQKELIFRNIKDIVLLHERWYTRARSKAKCINVSNHSNRTRVFSGVSFLGWGSVP